MKSSLARLTLAQRELYPLAQAHRRRHRPEFQTAICKGLCEADRSTDALPFTSAPNKFEHMAGHDAYVFVHGAINSTATALFKIANDIRLMGSGPRSGLGELILPSNELGSSIMPGKTNPTQSEALTMSAARCLEIKRPLQWRVARGILKLNVYKPLLAYCMMQSTRLLATPSSPLPTIASSEYVPTKRASAN